MIFWKNIMVALWTCGCSPRQRQRLSDAGTTCSVNCLCVMACGQRGSMGLGRWRTTKTVHVSTGAFNHSSMLKGACYHLIWQNALDFDRTSKLRRKYSQGCVFWVKINLRRRRGRYIVSGALKDAPRMFQIWASKQVTNIAGIYHKFAKYKEHQSKKSPT